MREVRGFIQLVDPQAFHPVQRPFTHYKWTESAGLVRANDDQLQFAAVDEGIGTRLHPRVLMHWTVGFFSDKIP